MKYINITPKADSDIDQCYQWICKKNPDAALRFLASVERACAIVAEVPGIGSPRYADISLIRGVRMIKVGKGFENYLVFYVERDASIDVIRVLHSARNISEALSAPD